MRAMAAILCQHRWCQACLQALLERFGCSAISLSEPVEDGVALLGVASNAA